MPEDISSRTFHGLKWSAYSQVARRIIGLVISVVLMRVLGPESFGLVAMAMVAVGFAQIFSEMGFAKAIVQRRELEDKHLNAALWMSISAGFTLGGIILLCAPAIAWFYNDPQLTPLLRVLSLVFFLSSFRTVQYAQFQKRMQFKELALLEGLAEMVAGLVAVVMALRGFGVWSLVVQQLVISAVTSAAVWIISPWRPRAQFDIGAIKDLFSFSANYMGFTILNYWLRNLDKLLIGKIIGPIAVGYYSRAYILMLLPISQVTQIIGRVMFAALSEIQHDKERVVRVYMKSVGMMGVFIFPAMTGLIVVARPLMLTLYGPKWEESIEVFQILCIVGMLQSIGATTAWIYMSQGRTDLLMRWSVLASVITVPSFFVGLKWGAEGVALGYAAANILLIYPCYTIPGKIIGFTVLDVLDRLKYVTLCSVIMGAVVYFVGHFLTGDLPAWLDLAIRIPIGAAVYWALLQLFLVPSYRDCLDLLKNRMHRPRVETSAQ